MQIPPTSGRDCSGFSFLVPFLVVAMLFAALPARALVIIPSWDSTITNDPNAAAIQNTINMAIQFYQARFSDPITVTIRFQEMTTAGQVGHSEWWYFDRTYTQFRADLQNDTVTTNDAIALAHLPLSNFNPATGTGTVRVKTANLKALGITGLNSGLPGGVDGIIGLHMSEINISRASINPAKYDLLAVTEHEMDEVLGLASSLDLSASDPLPEDLFRYTSSGSRTFTTNGDDAYFSLDGVNRLARFNQNPGGDYGDWWTAGTHKPQVQDAFLTAGTTSDAGTELIALDVIGYDLLPVPKPGIIGFSISGSDLVLKGTNGLATGTYHVLTSTDASLPLNQWTPVATNMLIASGAFSMTATNAVNRNDARQFFILQLQGQ